MGSIQGLLDWGFGLRVAAVVAYSFAFLGYALRLAVRKLKIDQVATGLAVIAVGAHTAYLVTRWIAAGRKVDKRCDGRGGCGARGGGGIQTSGQQRVVRIE